MEKLTSLASYIMEAILEDTIVSCAIDYHKLQLE